MFSSSQENPSDPDSPTRGAICRRRYRTLRIRFLAVAGGVPSCSRTQTPSCLRYARGLRRNRQSFQIYFGQFQGNPHKLVFRNFVFVCRSFTAKLITCAWCVQNKGCVRGLNLLQILFFNVTEHVSAHDDERGVP